MGIDRETRALESGEPMKLREAGSPGPKVA